MALKLDDKLVVGISSRALFDFEEFNSIEHYGLNISRAALVGGAKISQYLHAFRTDLFLSANENDVQEAINANIAAGIICSHSELPIDSSIEIEQIRIAFDGEQYFFRRI